MISAVGASSNYALTRNLTKKRQHLERKQTKLRAPSLRKIAAELARSGHLTAYGRLYVASAGRACSDECRTGGHLCGAASLLVGTAEFLSQGLPTEF
jgi:hypothetical protein